MSEYKYPPVSPEELERAAKDWDLGLLTPGGWQEAPEAVPRAGASTTISLRMPAQMLAVLKAFAQREGVGYQVLMKRWIDDRIRQERDQIKGRKVMNSSDPKTNTAPNLDEAERHFAQETRQRESATLGRIEALLNAFLPAFRETGKFTPTESNRREQVWWLFAGQSFNSLRWAFHLLQPGYYTQALILLRSVEENWLVCEDCRQHPKTVEALFDDSKRMPTFRDMANRLPDHLRNTWQAAKGDAEQTYDILSTISHPRPRALRLAFHFENNRPGVGPAYDEALFILTALNILVGAISIAGFLAELVSDNSKKLLEVEIRRANDFLTPLTQRGRALTTNNIDS